MEHRGLEIHTVRNFAIDILVFSSNLVTSARASSFMAEGPVGMSIIVNHSIGSDERILVRLARAQTTAILILVVISEKYTIFNLFGYVRGPEEESHANDEQESPERHMSRLLSLLHLAQAETQLGTNNENL